MHIPELKNPEVTLLIGTDVPEAHWRLEERRGRKNKPYAIRTSLWWSVAGPMGTTSGDEEPALPKNRILAKRRLHSLGVRFRKDPDLYEKYKDEESQFPAQIFAAKQREVSTH